jgi:hypothetical protein
MDVFPELVSGDAAAVDIMRARENTRAEDAALHVRFYKGALQDNRPETLEANKLTKKKQTYELVPFVEIQRRGEKDVLRRPAWIDDDNQDADNHRWPKKWDNFVNERPDDGLDGGTRLSEAPFMNAALAAEFAHEKIFTVEQLVAVSDGALQRVAPGALSLKEKAKAFMELKRGNIPAQQAAELASTKAQVADLAAKLEELKKSTRKQA